MSLNDTPSGERVHIGFFGRRNAGKSSVVNAVTGQDLSVVSDVRGTTTDPVRKSMELLPMGPVVIIDTPGFDDEGSLGELRVRKTKNELNRTDVAVLVVDAQLGLGEADEQILSLFREKDLPYIIVWNKSDLISGEAMVKLSASAAGRTGAGTAGGKKSGEIFVSALKGTNIQELKELIAHLSRTDENKMQLVGDLIHPADIVLLVIPIDKAAPKGRLILPQQQVIRDVLEADAAAMCVKEYELREMLEKLGTPPALVITDSQVFSKVSADVPPEIPLTSFSILMARYKGMLDTAVEGVQAIEKLEDGDTVLISEGCSHHRQCDDIGTVKIPRWLRNYTGKKINIESSSGMSFPEDLSKYSLIIHCGGCMLGEREVRYRKKCAVDQKIPITNYGITIAYMQGILKRSVSVFPHLLDGFEDKQ